MSVDSIARDRSSLRRGLRRENDLFGIRNSPIDANVLIWLELDGETHGTPARGAKDALDWNWQLIAVRKLGTAPWKWLGGRESTGPIRGSKGRSMTYSRSCSGSVIYGISAIA